MLPGNNKSVEGHDYYINEKGLWVFTEQFHLKRGYCCKNKCLHCPYGFNNKNKKMTIHERIERAETRIFKTVFPNTTNHYDTLFGGTAMHLMDEVAFITATRFSRKEVVTVSSDRIDFKHPIPSGTIIELVGKVIHIGNTSLKIQVDIYVEQMYSEERELAVSGKFTFVAIDENKQPQKIC